MVDATFYNKDSGYYVTTTEEHGSSKVEKQQVDDNGELIAFPWDDDSFSLCLDTFPSSLLARNKYNQFPVTSSPLRKHWRSSSTTSDEEEEQEEERLSDKNSTIGSNSTVTINNVVTTIRNVATATPNVVTAATNNIVTTNNAVTATSNVATENNAPSSLTSSIAMLGEDYSTMSRAKKRLLKAKKTKMFIKTEGIFPYNNDENFLDRIIHEEQQQQKPLSTNTNFRKQPVIVQQQQQQQRGRVEHISPFSNSSILFPQDDILSRSGTISTRKMSTTSSIKSKLSSIVSFPREGGGGHSINGDSQISDSGTIESWKVVQSPLVSMSSPIVLPRPRQYNPTPSNEYYPFQHSPSRSGSVTPSTVGTMTHALSYSASVNSYYSHDASISGASSPASTYRSIPVPRNADNLMYFSNTPSSIYSTTDQSEYTEKSRPYSQYFNPSYISGTNTSSKKRRSERGSKQGRKSVGLFTKLMKNIKQHFNK